MCLVSLAYMYITHTYMMCLRLFFPSLCAHVPRQLCSRPNERGDALDVKPKAQRRNVGGFFGRNVG